MLFQYPHHDKATKVFCKESKYLELKEWGFEGEPFFKEIDKKSKIFKEKTIYRTYDTLDEKILINYHRDIYHCLFDVLGTILYEHQKNRNVLFLINIADFESNFFKETYNLFFFNTLNKLKVKYEVLCLPPNNIIHISNFYTYYKYLPSMYDIFALIELTGKEFYTDKKPDKKVYVGRKKVTRTKTEYQMFGNTDKSNLLFTDDKRLDNEEIMEKFFQSLGFEIIYPEDFGSFEDQIKYFSTVKVLAGVTSAGLINAIFMPRGGTVLELSTPLLAIGREAVHHFYREISFLKQHTFISITNFRKSQYIINSIKKNKGLVNLLNE